MSSLFIVWMSKVLELLARNRSYVCTVEPLLSGHLERPRGVHN